MQRAGATHLLALVLLSALLLAMGTSAARPVEADARGQQASSHHGKGAAKARKAAKRAKAKRIRRARANRRILALRRANRRHGVGKQVALTGQRAPEAQNSEVLFRSDFETGFDGWHVQAIPSRATLSSGVAFEGNGSARFEVQNGDVEPDTGSERSEVSGPTFDEGQDIYIRDAIRVAGSSSYDGPWQIVQQLHEENWSGSPGLALFLDSDDALTLGSGDGSLVLWESARLQRDRWYDVVYRVYLSQDASTGFVEVWLDGAQQVLASGQSRAYGATLQASQTYLKAGIYRSKESTGTSLVEHDNLVVGTSLGAVLSG